MKKFLMFICAVTLVFGMVGSASAIPIQFELNAYDVTLNEADPGLVLYWEPILTTPISAELEVGESTTFNLFTLGSDEAVVDEDDLVKKEISVAFEFSSPEISTTGTGKTEGGILWTLSGARVEWINPVNFTFGTTGLFTIALENDAFWLPGSADIEATLTYVKADTAPVPEPSTILLLGSGLLGLVGYGRTRFSKKS